MSLPVARGAIAAMTPAAIAQVREFERMNLQRAQVPIATHHLIHAGVYARTITIPAGVVLTGALVKRATILILDGDAMVSRGDHCARFAGYHVLPASAQRKQAFYAYADTFLTMLFATQAQSVEQAENEFTDEADMLMSRHGENTVLITGE